MENAYRGEEFSDISNALVQLKSNNNSPNPEENISLQTLLPGNNTNKKDYLLKIFRKYIQPGSL
jgi:hypothetical protein